MVIDRIENAEKYVSLHPPFGKVFEALKKLTADSPAGRTEVDGDSAFVNFSSYENKDVSDCKFESHKKYIDIQYVVKGHEHIDVCAADALVCTDDRLDSGDIAFYENTDCFSTADLSDGWFVILYPGEAHRPLVAPDGKPVFTAKAVGKIIQ